MFSNASVLVSQSILKVLGTQMFVYHQDRIPRDLGGAIVVSNHRSFMDAFMLMAALDRPVRFACHHYMGQMPILREFVVELLGCFPLEQPEKRPQSFFKQARELLQKNEWVGIFPEGGEPMVNLTSPREVGKFERGFAHLALRGGMPNIVIIPVAIASTEETIGQTFPLKFLHLVDPSEPLFDSWNLQPAIFYHRVNVAIGRPYWIDRQQREQYRGKTAKQLVENITTYCRQEITTLVDLNCR